MPSAVCPKETAQDGPSLFQNGNLVFQAHHVGWIVSILFTLAATVTSFWLIGKHLRWYTNKREQRYIVRILFMVPIYAWISLASYFFWNHSTPLLLIRDAYESTVLTSFFYLLLVYISPNPDEQRLVFRKSGLSMEADLEATRKGTPVKKWVFPLNFVKWKPIDGLYFLQLMKWGVLQYCVVRPTTTLAAVILDYAGLYCEESWGFQWGHIYITAIISVSVSIAMYCLVQLYVAVSDRLKPKKPLLKLFAIKAVVFLTFWQATFLGVLSMLGVVKDTQYMTAADINIGIGALLETFEMMIFGFLHVKAFSYKPYRPSSSPDDKDEIPTPTPRFKSLVHAMNFRETISEIWNGTVYLADKARGRTPQADASALQVVHYEEAFGRVRPSQMVPDPIPKRDFADDLAQDEYGTPQWLRNTRSSRYFMNGREKSEGLEEQITRELETRGYGDRFRPPSPSPGVSHNRQRSWWRSLYERVSSSREGGSNHPYLPESSHSGKIYPMPKDNYDPSMGLLMHQETTDPITEYQPSHVRRHHKSRVMDRDISPPSAGEPSHGHRARRSSRHRNGDQNPQPDRRRREKRHRTTSKHRAAPANPNADSDSVLGRVFPQQGDIDQTTTQFSHTQETNHIQYVAGERNIPKSQVHPLAKQYKEGMPSTPYRSSTIHSREPANFRGSSPDPPVFRPPISFHPSHRRKVTPVMPQLLASTEGRSAVIDDTHIPSSSPPPQGQGPQFYNNDPS